jgi:uncharacterized repeat protein (TIGR03803 family)
MKSNSGNTVQPKPRKFNAHSSRFLAVAAITLTLAANSWAASKEAVLYTFQGGSDGAVPAAGLIADAQGNLYGTTFIRGNFDAGTVFKLTRNKNGSFTETTIYTFQGNLNGTADGAGPSANLVFDHAGNLYGTTTAGGANPPISDGTVFKLTPTKSGEWKETILHSFNCTEGKGDNDGCDPNSYLLFDQAGNLYGTTVSGGGGDFTTFCQNGCGTVFKLSPNKDGSWTESLIHTFPRGNGGTPDGQNPYAGLIIDSSGNLYGTTWIGGPDDEGIIFRLAPQSNGTWKETVLFSFHDLINNPPDGANPNAGLLMDKAGNLYGTTRDGGGKVTGGGVVFQLTPTTKGEWKEKVIHAFPSPRYHDGELVMTGLVADAAGNFYGAALVGGGKQEPNCGDYDGCGVVFKLSPNSNGTWSETILYAFQGGSDGAFPQDDRMVVDASGNVYGTTSGGGIGGGVVFEIRK